jgi:hypothetical protein
MVAPSNFSWWKLIEEGKKGGREWAGINEFAVNSGLLANTSKFCIGLEISDH